MFFSVSIADIGVDVSDADASIVFIVVSATFANFVGF